MKIHLLQSSRLSGLIGMHLWHSSSEYYPIPETVVSAGFWSSVRNILQNLPSYESLQELLVDPGIALYKSIRLIMLPWKISSVAHQTLLLCLHHS